MQFYSSSIDSSRLSISPSYGIRITGKFYDKDKYSCPAIVTSKTVDLTPWSKIKITFHFSSGLNYPGIDTSHMYFYDTSKKVIMGLRLADHVNDYTAPLTDEIDVSSINQHAFISFAPYTLRTYDNYLYAYVTKIEFVP